MPELICTVPIPRTAQELEQAVRDYRNQDLAGLDLLCHWQAIRDASLMDAGVVESPVSATDAELEPVPGGDSY